MNPNATLESLMELPDHPKSPTNCLTSITQAIMGCFDMSTQLSTYQSQLIIIQKELPS